MVCTRKAEVYGIGGDFRTQRLRGTDGLASGVTFEVGFRQTPHQRNASLTPRLHSTGPYILLLVESFLPATGSKHLAMQAMLI